MIMSSGGHPLLSPLLRALNGDSHGSDLSSYLMSTAEHLFEIVSESRRFKTDNEDDAANLGSRCIGSRQFREDLQAERG